MVSQAEDEQKALAASVDPVRRVLSCEKSVFYIKIVAKRKRANREVLYKGKNSTAVIENGGITVTSEVTEPVRLASCIKGVITILCVRDEIAAYGSESLAEVISTNISFLCKKKFTISHYPTGLVMRIVFKSLGVCEYRIGRLVLQMDTCYVTAAVIVLARILICIYIIQSIYSIVLERWEQCQTNACGHDSH